MLKLVLDEEWTPVVEVYGISSHVRDYRLCWSLNTAMGLAFSKLEGATDGSRFECRVTTKDMVYNLVQNRTSKGMLLPELKQVDYLFYVHYGEDAEKENHSRKLHEAQFVNAIISLDENKQKQALQLIEVDGY